MIAHTNDFKTAIGKFGRQIKADIGFDKRTEIINENAYNIVTEDNAQIVTERKQDYSQLINGIGGKDINSIEIIKNGNLFQSLMQECNFEAKTDNLNFEIKIGDEFVLLFYVLVNGSYQSIIFRNFVVYSKEYNVKDKTWKYTCYDRMLWAMKKYTRLNITYPITIRDYIKAIANKLGLGFSEANSEFVNYDKLIYKDYFADKNVTYRDILDKISQIIAGNIVVSSSSLHIVYPTETNDTINETYIKDINVNFGDQYGPINKIEVTDSTNNLSYTAKDNDSINQYGETKINIVDNPFIFNGEEVEICQNILNQLKTLRYSINDFTTTGVCYYEFLDLFNVSIGENTYKCLLLNDEINITQGLEESIFTEKLENTETETDNYINTQNKDTQSQIAQINDDKVGKNNVVNSINNSTEQSIIKTSKILLIKTINDTTDSNGFLNTNLTYDYIICSATANFTNNNYGFIIPYYDYNNGSPIWKLKLEDKDNIALSNTQITVTIYYFRKEV